MPVVLPASSPEPSNLKPTSQDDAVEYLSHRGYDPAFGARPVKRVVQRELESELARASCLLFCYSLSAQCCVSEG